MLCTNCSFFQTGMNFFDFFIFLSRFFLANIAQLCCQHGDNEISVSSSSQVAHHLAVNLVSIRRIALKMKSIDGVAGNRGFFLDLRETLDDPEFLKLCIDVGRTYAMISRQQNGSFHTKKALMAELVHYTSHICSPDDFVKFIDYAVTKLSGTCCKENILLSKLVDQPLFEG